MGLINADHTSEEDGKHYMQVEVEFFPTDEVDDSGDKEWTVGHIQTHFHGAPPQMIVDALLVIARDVVTQGITQQMFNEAVPEAVRNIAARVMATQFLTSRIQDPDIINTESVSANIPDDVSSLLEPEG
jgi:hypothetical protein